MNRRRIALSLSDLPLYASPNRCGAVRWSTTFTRVSPSLKLGPKAKVLCGLCGVEVVLGDGTARFAPDQQT